MNLLIYYPEERRAFRFISRNRLMIPFAQSFIGLVREDSGLSGAGFFLLEKGENGEEGEVRDEIRYSDHRINQVLPAEVTGFRLPSDVSVEELKW